MDALAKAIEYAIDAEIELDKDNEYVIAQAALIQAYAAIAQAQAAERQVAAMEKLVKLVEMITPPLQGVYAPDATGYSTEKEYSEAMEEYRYRKAQAQAWAKAERGE